MAERFPFPGETWNDVCAFNSQWYHAACVGTRVHLRTKSAIQWSAPIGVETIGVRCAADHVGRVVVVGKHHDTGHVVAAYDGQSITNAKLNVNVHGPTGICVTYDFQRHEWLLWRMHDGFTLATLRIDPNPFRIDEWSYQDIRHLMPEGTADGFSYTLPGPDGYAVPQFTLLTRNQIPGLVMPSPAGEIWVGQHPQDPPRLMAYQEGIGRQTLDTRDAFEPHVVEYAPGKFAACSWDRPARTATVVEFETPLVADVVPDLPVTDPGRPFGIGAYHNYLDPDREDWGTLELPSTLDVIGERRFLTGRPCLVGIDAIPLSDADTSFVQGLYVGREGSPFEVQSDVLRIIDEWRRLHPRKPTPPVCIYLTAGMRAQWDWVDETDAAVLILECYWKTPFPPDPETWMRDHAAAWVEDLEGDERPRIGAVQFYDRNNDTHRANMDAISRLAPLFLELGAEHGWVAIIAFTGNRPGGIVTYPDLLRQFIRIRGVCTPQTSVGPFTPVEQPVKPPRFSFVIRGERTVEINQWVNVEIQPQPGSGPITEVEWYHDVIGDGQPPRFADRTFPATHGLTNKFKWGVSGQFEIVAKGKGPGGEYEERSARITVRAPQPSPTPPPQGTPMIRYAEWRNHRDREEHTYRDLSDLHPPIEVQTAQDEGAEIWVQHYFERPQGWDHQRVSRQIERTIYVIWGLPPRWEDQGGPINKPTPMPTSEDIKGFYSHQEYLYREKNPNPQVRTYITHVDGVGREVWDARYLDLRAGRVSGQRSPWDHERAQRQVEFEQDTIEGREPRWGSQFNVTPTPTPTPTPGGGQTVAGRLHVSSHRGFSNDVGSFDVRDVTSMAAADRYVLGHNMDPYLDQWRSLGATSLRILLGMGRSNYWRPRGVVYPHLDNAYFEGVPAFCDRAASYGLYVRVGFFGAIDFFTPEPLEDRRDHYDSSARLQAREYVRRMCRSLRRCVNVWGEVANEADQIGFGGHPFDDIVDLGHLIKSEFPELILSGTSENGPNWHLSTFMRDPFDYGDSHMDRRRGYGGFEWVKRSSEAEAVDQDRMPFLSGEPINFGSNAPERPDGSDNERSAAVALAYAATSRMKRYMTNFHLDAGLNADLMDEATLSCARAWQRGLDLIPWNPNADFLNGHWAQSPFNGDNFPSHGDDEDSWPRVIRIFGNTDGYWVSVGHRRGFEPRLKSGRSVTELVREEHGDYECRIWRE